MVTAAVSPAAVTPLAPVLGALAAMTDRYPVHGVVPGLYVTDRAGWLPATEIVYGDAFDDMLEAAGKRWTAPPHIAAALAWKCYAYWVALPAVLGYATARRVPLMEPSQVLVRYADHQPFLCAGLASPGLAVLPTDPLVALDLPGVRVVPDEAALLATLRYSLVGAHLGPIVERMHLRLHLGRRTLWGSLASGIAHGVSRAADVVAGSTLETTGALLSSLGLDDLVDVAPEPSGRLRVQRRTCCLAFALPGARICTGCVIRSS
jgi:Ferric iron reductase FhuF-like transporter